MGCKDQFNEAVLFTIFFNNYFACKNQCNKKVAFTAFLTMISFLRYLLYVFVNISMSKKEKDFFYRLWLKGYLDTRT